MQVFAVPVDGLFIVYRPLVPLAFVGNRAVAEVALRVGEGDSSVAISAEVRGFLEGIGFFRPDPPHPPSPSRDWHPTTAVMLLTNRCNLRCAYCYADAGEAVPRDTGFDFGRAAVDVVCRNAIETGAPRFEVCFHGGGEPMQAWGVMRQVAGYARSKGHPCDLTMVSNGVWSRAQREWVLATLTSVTISLDGGRETQDRQRPLRSGKGSFEHVMATTRALDSAGFRYGIRLTATAPWRVQLPADVRFLCENTGCQEFQVEPAFNTQRGTHRQASLEEGDAFVEGFTDAHEVATAMGRRLTYSGARPWLRGRAFCTAPYDALIVNADGNLVSCYEIASDSHWLAALSTIGHVQGADVVVDHSARCRLLDYLETKQERQCRDCFCRWHCAGDCYTRSSVLGEGGLEATRERCRVNQGITKQLILRNILASGGTVWAGDGA